MSTTLTLDFEDFTGQARHRARNIPTDATVGEVLSSVTQLMGLPDTDPEGHPILYQATAGTNLLNAGDRIGDVVEDHAGIQLTKTVTAG